MDKKLIGNIKTFGIEYLILKVNPSPPYGNCRLWLEENFLGDIEDEIYLTAVSSYLEGVVLDKDRLFLEEDLYHLPEEEIFNLILKEEVSEADKHWFVPISGFDAFRKFVYRKEDWFHFIWMVHPDLEGDDDYKDFPSGLRFAKVSISLYEKVVQEFKQALLAVYSF